MRRDHLKPVNSYIGNRIKRRRRQIKISQTELGKKVNLTFQQIQKYEHGINFVGAALLLNISEALGVPITYFFDGVSMIRNDDDNFAEDYMLLDLILNVPPNLKRSLVCIVECLVRSSGKTL